MPLEPTKCVNGRMWPPGVSGNPNGRPVGSRTAFSQGFLKDLAEVWREHGRDTMLHTAKTPPATLRRAGKGASNHERKPVKLGDLRRGRPSWGPASLMRPAEDRARRNVRVLAAMLRTARKTQQLSRLSDPMESCATSYHKAYNKNLGPAARKVKERRDAPSSRE